MPPDEQFADWCRRLRRGDRAAFRAVFEAMHDALFRYAARIVGSSAARDVVQDVFAELWERRANLDPDRAPRALLYRMARNRAYNVQRHRRTRRTRSDAFARDANAGAAPLSEQRFDAQRLEERLRAWIDELPDRQREALHLSRFDGLTHDEVAAVMGIAPRTVNNHIVRALRQLRTRLSAYEPELLDS